MYRTIGAMKNLIGPLDGAGRVLLGTRVEQLLIESALELLIGFQRPYNKELLFFDFLENDCGYQKCDCAVE